MTVIVVDTNILRDCPRLDNAVWTSLIEHAHDWGVRIVVPEVVFMESIKQVRQLWRQDRNRLTDLRLGHFDLAETQAAMVDAIDQQAAEYEEWLTARLKELGIDIRPLPPVDAMAIARRSSEGRAPFTRNEKGKGKDSYRDTLLWLTLMAVAADNPEDEVWLVSENHTDFGPKPPHWTGTNTGSPEDCPIRFHNDLMDDLATHGLAGQVHYVVRVAVLEQHLASQFAPIDADDLKQLVEAIDMSTLAGQLMVVTLGRRLDPDAAALPAGVVLGEIVGVHEQQQGWEFTDAARRGTEGWTARFAVDTEIDIAIAGAPWLGSECTKVLAVTGRVAVSSTGDIVEMAVDSIEATPGDPERVRRARRHDADATKAFADQFSNPDLLRGIAGQFSGAELTKGFADQFRNPDLLKGFADQFSSPDLLKGFADQFSNPDLLKGIAGHSGPPNRNEPSTTQNGGQSVPEEHPVAAPESDEQSETTPEPEGQE
ncbi:PIN domain-containing protein [Mycolicibacterium llatzerense]|uniref:PIN domain-containing protein n=1 Tax=Mycolicibacterium llatzerense TaxID=280871 RepID=UPI0021B6CF35|nr:PIN domain-containing protein [Mycolicibacterium llatzerense]